MESIIWIEYVSSAYSVCWFFFCWLFLGCCVLPVCAGRSLNTQYISKECWQASSSPFNAKQIVFDHQSITLPCMLYLMLCSWKKSLMKNSYLMPRLLSIVLSNKIAIYLLTGGNSLVPNFQLITTTIHRTNSQFQILLFKTNGISAK